MAGGPTTDDLLVADHAIEYTYTRSAGPVIGAFMAALREQRILGVRGSDGRVIVPPAEYDPLTAEPLAELVEVASEGTVTAWSWNAQPLAGQPLDRPFAWALIRLDGADTAMLHAVDCTSPDRIATGARVRARWAPQRHGSIRDIAAFEVVA